MKKIFGFGAILLAVSVMASSVSVNVEQEVDKIHAETKEFGKSKMKEVKEFQKSKMKDLEMRIEKLEPVERDVAKKELQALKLKHHGSKIGKHHGERHSKLEVSQEVKAGGCPEDAMRR